MVRICCVLGCTNKSHDSRGRKLDNGLRFFTFPTWKKSYGPQIKEISKRRRSAWVAAVRRKDITFDKITPFMFVCCRHFHKGKPAYEMMENDPDWAPSLHMGHTENEHGNSLRSDKRKKSVLRIQEAAESAEEEPARCEEALTLNIKQEKEEELVKWERTECCGIGTKKVNQEEMLIEAVKREAGQTECNFCIQRSAEVSRLVEENRRLRHELDAFKIPDGFFQDDDNKVEFYTGLPNVASFMTFFSFLLPFMPARHSRLSPFQVLLLTFMRLRLDLPTQHLAHIFSITTSTVETTFRETVSFLYAKLKPSITWPSRNTLQRTMPRRFVEAFGGKAVAIVDCFKLQLSHDDKLDQSNSAVQYLIAVTPGGFVGFVSKGCDEFIAAKNVLEKSGFLNSLLPGDVVLANSFDKSGDLFCAEVDGPTCVRANCLLAENVMAHVETGVGNMRRKYQIFKAAVPVDMTLACDGEEVTLLDKMVTVCYALENPCPSTI
ncbi:uncharacterized protein zgc:113019 isoform X1 [Syngnathus acus]|uniref:uncharacterized protein zgc:113019 isoform X1 n=1 Tax=Syngnathus acus TaxID=161584 RepID=UPI00188604D5|nr:uncharacterized protein zgc:113019 isoform X1 [Syngnathus acus]